MYLAEWASWEACITPKKANRKPVMGSKPRQYIESRTEDIKTMMAARHPRAKLTGPVYACNDTFLELRCGTMEQWRGLMTIAVLMWLGFAVAFSVNPVMIDLADFQKRWASDSTGVVVTFIFCVTIFIGMFYAYYRFAFQYSRMEIFTTRHLLVRFNRITRQVYIHRPKNCGGVVVMPWEKTSCQCAPDLNMALTWDLQDGEYGFPTVSVMVGRPCRKEDDLLAQWEFIRRYMDDGGLANLKKPRWIFTHFPSPIQAFMPQSIGDPIWYFVKEGHYWLLLIHAFLSIGSLPIKLGHWFSLLLCVRPRWPKIIREAGQPGKPIPKISTIDDYPPDIAALLKAHAYRWKITPKPEGEAEEEVEDELDQDEREAEEAWQQAEEAARLEAEEDAKTRIPHTPPVILPGKWLM